VSPCQSSFEALQTIAHAGNDALKDRLRLKPLRTDETAGKTISQLAAKFTNLDHVPTH